MRKLTQKGEVEGDEVIGIACVPYIFSQIAKVRNQASYLVWKGCVYPYSCKFITA